LRSDELPQWEREYLERANRPPRYKSIEEIPVNPNFFTPKNIYQPVDKRKYDENFMRIFGRPWYEDEE